MTCSRAPFDLSMWPMSEGAQPAALRRRGAECADPDVLLGTTAAPNRDLEAERCKMEKGCQVNSYYNIYNVF